MALLTANFSHLLLKPIHSVFLLIDLAKKSMSRIVKFRSTLFSETFKIFSKPLTPWTEFFSALKNRILSLKVVRHLKALSEKFNILVI
jgi:hypothetical protein